MKPVRRVLFAIKNTSTRRHAALDKAARIAKSLDASLELFNAISTPVFLDAQPLTGKSFGELKREALTSRLRDLEKLAARACKTGVDTTFAVEWDFPPHEAIVRQAKRIDADLVIAEVHEGGRLKPWLMHLTDWELLRTCPVPVLILKNTHAWRRPVVLAAVDPSHAHSKPPVLDDAIVGHALQFARKLGGTLNVVHATAPPAFGLELAELGLDAESLSEEYEAQHARNLRVFEAFAETARIPRGRRRVFVGDPVHAIPEAARQMSADLVVMGAVSRTGLKRVFIGNTAERVLGALPCDVLVVKPAHTAKSVARRPRGMRVVARLPILSMHG